MGTRLNVKVIPGASGNSISGWLGDSLKVRVAAPPEKGKANQAVASLLSRALDVPVRSVRLFSGASSQRKVFEIDGKSLSDIRQRIPGDGV